MATRFSLCYLLLYLGYTSAAQSVSTTIGARGAGLGNATATLHDDWALLNNPGGLTGSENIVTAFTYDAHPGLSGANRAAAVFLVPVKIGVAGLGLFRFGDDLYSEQIISAGYANKFGIASLGLKVNFIQYHAEGFGFRNAVSLNFGGIAQVAPKILIGAYMININQSRISHIDQERLPAKLVAGICFRAGEQVTLLGELEKDLSYPATVKGGIEYAFHKKAFLRTGFNIHPGAGFFGLGMHASRINFDYAFQYLENLGAAHQVSIGMKIRGKKPVVKK